MNNNLIPCPKCREGIPRPPQGTAQVRCRKCGTALRLVPAKSAMKGPAPARDPFAFGPPLTARRPRRRVMPTLFGLAALLLLGGAGAAVVFWDHVSAEIAQFRPRTAATTAAPSAEAAPTTRDRDDPDRLPAESTTPDKPIDLGPSLSSPDLSPPSLTSTDLVPPVPGLVTPRVPLPGSEGPAGMKPTLPSTSPPRTAPKSPEVVASAITEQYEAIKKEHETTLAAYRAANADEERRKLSEQYQKIFPRMLALAETHPQDGRAAEVLLWVAANTPLT